MYEWANDSTPLCVCVRVHKASKQLFKSINLILSLFILGIITTTARKLDRENQPEHILEVMISDNGMPQLSSTTRIVIEVDDINDHSPEFDQKLYKVQIPANAIIDQSLFQVIFSINFLVVHIFILLNKNNWI